MLDSKAPCCGPSHSCHLYSLDSSPLICVTTSNSTVTTMVPQNGPEHGQSFKDHITEKSSEKAQPWNKFFQMSETTVEQDGASLVRTYVRSLNAVRTSMTFCAK